MTPCYSDDSLSMSWHDALERLLGSYIRLRRRFSDLETSGCECHTM